MSLIEGGGNRRGVRIGQFSIEGGVPIETDMHVGHFPIEKGC